MQNLWTTKEDEIIKKYYPIKEVKAFSNLLPGRTIGTIRTRINKLGLKKINRTSWSDNEIKILIENYGKRFAKDIEPLLPLRTNNAIICKAQELGLEGRWDIGQKYTVNSNYFSIPNLENSYYAGLIAADGCVRSSSERCGTLHIGLEELDLDYLEKFRQNIKYSGPLIRTIGRQRQDGSYNVINTLSIHDKQIFDDLNKNFNIVPKKTFILEPPNLAEDLALAYIAGLSDGDGCMGWHHSSFYWNISGTYNVLNWAKNILITRFNYKKAMSIRKSKSIFVLSSYGQESINICKEIHKLNLPYLDRKWSKIYE